MPRTGQDRRASAGTLTARLGIFGLACAVVGPLTALVGLVAPFAGFIAMALGLLLALLSIVSGLIAVARGGGGQALRAMVPGILVVTTVAVVLTVGGGGGHPRINDITTDTDAPPAFVQALKLPENAGRDMRYAGPELARQQRDGYPNLAPLRLDVAPEQAFTRARVVAKETGNWTITREDPAARAIEGYDTSRLFRFRDDFVIEVRPDGGGSVVHMRSKSRNGQGDMGVNAARIEAFLTRLRGSAG